MVSPPRRSRIRPIALFVLNNSIGITGCLRSDVAFKWICTLATAFLVITRGFDFIVAPVWRSIVSISIAIVAGMSLDWWKSSTVVPGVIGSEVSKTTIFAMNRETKGTRLELGHRTLPILRSVMRVCREWRSFIFRNKMYLPNIDPIYT